MKSKTLLIVATGFLAASALASDTVKYLGHEVSATSVLAKLKTGKGTKSVVANSLNSNPDVSSFRGFDKIPSVVVIKLKQGAQINTAKSPQDAEKAKAAELDRQLTKLRSSGLFEYVEPNYIVRPHALPSDSAFADGTLWGLRNQGQNGGVPNADINAVGAWQKTTGSSDVVVAVIDTGIRYTHTDLAANMWVNPDEIPANGIDDDNNGHIDDIHGINAIPGIANSGDPMDLNGHGSHCAGTIGAVANGGGPNVGVAWNVRLMALKFLDPYGEISDAITCIDYAIAKGAQIMSNSWGGGGYSNALADAIERANTAGILFVASAGNSESDTDLLPNFPASYPNSNVISVAALDRSDKLAGFSSYGQQSVDLGAPGVDIYSCSAQSDTSYVSMNGTSMAAPHVSGTAALIKSHMPSAGVSELKQRLMASTRTVDDLEWKCVTGGALDAAAALSINSDGVLELALTTSPSPAFGGASLAVHVVVSDLQLVTGATVSGTMAAQGPIPFLDNGVYPDSVANDGSYAAQFDTPQTTLQSLPLTLNVTAAGKQPVSGRVFQIPVISPPENDNFENRALLANGTKSTTGINQLATSQRDEPLNPPSATGRTVWWKWTPGFSGIVTFNTEGSNFDTTLAVYSGSSLASLILMGSNDDSTSIASSVTFNATAGTEYSIQVDGSYGVAGLIALNYPDPGSLGAPPAIILEPSDLQVLVGNPISLAVEAQNADAYQWYFNGDPIAGATSSSFAIAVSDFANTGVYHCDVRNAYGTVSSRGAVVFVRSSLTSPVNDNFADATPLSEFSGQTYGSNLASSGEPDEPNHANASDDGGGLTSVWWNWTAPADGEIVLETAGSDFDTTLAIYTGDSPGELSELDSNDDYEDRTSRVSLAVSAGAVYRIAVAGKNSSTGLIILNHFFTPTAADVPQNDDFANRTVLDPVWYTIFGSNRFATGESGEPDHAFVSSPLQSVWWEWTPVESGMVSIDTLGSDFDTTLGVYTGSGLGQLQTIASNNQAFGDQSRVLFPVVAGTTYYIALDGAGASTGSFSLNHSRWALPSDNGGNYEGFWTDGSNAGTGFNPWALFIDPEDGDAGAYIADPAESGITGMSPQSFAIHGKRGFALTKADRTFIQALEVGQTFSLQWGVNWAADHSNSGQKGFKIYSGDTEIVDVKTEGNTSITFNGADVGFGRGSQAMTWTFERVSYSELSVTANDCDGSGRFSITIDPGDSGITGLQLFAGDADEGVNQSSYYDNFRVSEARASISASPMSISGLTTNSGQASESQAIVLYAENLTQSLVVTAPSGFAVSNNDIQFSNTVTIEPAGGIVSSTIHIRIAGTAPVGPVAGNLILSSMGAEELAVSLSGEVTSEIDEGYQAGYNAGFADGLSHITDNPEIAAGYGLYPTDAIMDMNLGGLMIQRQGDGNLMLSLQLESTPDISNQPFRDYGEPIQIPVEMEGSKGFLRVRALGDK
jgi:subtilisin family serine protease